MNRERIRTAARSNRDPEVLASKRSALESAHMAPLAEYVSTIRADTGLDVPDFDPDSAGVAAKALLLLEAPGPQSASEQARGNRRGSGFISLDNDDRSAEAMWQLFREADLDRYSVLIWNFVPWYIGSESRIRNAVREDLEKAEPYVSRLLRHLPELRVVLALGRHAQEGWLTYLRTEQAPLLPTLACPHPSPRSLQTRPERRKEVLAALQKVGRVVSD